MCVLVCLCALDRCMHMCLYVSITDVYNFVLLKCVEIWQMLGQSVAIGFVFSDDFACNCRERATRIAIQRARLMASGSHHRGRRRRPVIMKATRHNAITRGLVIG